MYLGMSPPVGACLSDVEEGVVKALPWRWAGFGILNPRLAVVLLYAPSPQQGGVVGCWSCTPFLGHHAVMVEEPPTPASGK